MALMKSTTTVVLAQPRGAERRLSASYNTHKLNMNAPMLTDPPRYVTTCSGELLKLTRPSTANPTSAGDLDPGRNRRLRPEVAAQMHQHQMVVGERQLVRESSGLVAAAIVDEHDLVASAKSRERARNPPMQLVNVLLLVVQGDDDAQ